MSLTAILSAIATRHHSVVCMSSVTIMHLAKAVGQNEMPCGRDTCRILSNIVLDTSQPPVGRGELGVGIGNPQFAAMLLITKLLCPLLC